FPNAGPVHINTAVIYVQAPSLSFKFVLHFGSYAAIQGIVGIDPGRDREWIFDIEIGRLSGVQVRLAVERRSLSDLSRCVGNRSARSLRLCRIRSRESAVQPATGRPVDTVAYRSLVFPRPLRLLDLAFVALQEALLGLNALLQFFQ